MGGMVESIVFFSLLLLWLLNIALCLILVYLAYWITDPATNQRAYPHRCIYCVTYFRVNHTLIWKVTFQITFSLTHNISIVHIGTYSLTQSFSFTKPMLWPHIIILQYNNEKKKKMKRRTKHNWRPTEWSEQQHINFNNKK